MCSHAIADCLTCAWEAMLDALPDRGTDLFDVTVRGPMSTDGGPEFFRAVYIGWAPNWLSITAPSAAEAVYGLASELAANKERLLAWRRKAIADETPYGHA